MPAIHPVALICTAILGCLLFGLGLAVSSVRAKTNVHIGVTANPDSTLSRLVRAHGNTAEYAPFFAVLFLLLGSRSPTALVLWLIGCATVARVLLVLGLLTAKTLGSPSPLRFVGAVSTYIVGIWLCVLALLGA